MALAVLAWQPSSRKVIPMPELTPAIEAKLQGLAGVKPQPDALDTFVSVRPKELRALLDALAAERARTERLEQLREQVCFSTTQSGDGRYVLTVSFATIGALHDAHDLFVSRGALEDRNNDS
jgi:hypothetical protein